MRKKVTARDVAEHAGVSRSMVSMYLSKNPKLWISEETRKKLDASISELGYRPNRTAQVLRGGKTHVVGVVLGGISGQFASRMSEALMELLEEAGYRVFIGITKYDPARERKVLESMMNFEFDALFYTLHRTMWRIFCSGAPRPVRYSSRKSGRTIRFTASGSIWKNRWETPWIFWPAAGRNGWRWSRTPAVTAKRSSWR